MAAQWMIPNGTQLLRSGELHDLQEYMSARFPTIHSLAGFRSRPGTIYHMTNGSRDYIGKTTSPLHLRFNQHLYLARAGMNNELSKAIRDTGEASWRIHEIDAAPEWALPALERYWIKYRRTHVDEGLDGCNMTIGGKGTARPALKSRLAFRRIMTGRAITEEHRRNISKAAQSRRRRCGSSRKTNDPRQQSMF